MKLNSKLQLTAFFMSILMLTACGGGDSATPQLTPQVTTPVTPPSQSLKGSWSTQCQASKALDGYDEQDTFNFKGNTLTTNKTFYNQNTNCKHSEEALRAREVAGIKLGAEVNPGTDTGHTKIDITPSKVILAPMNYEIQNLFKIVNDSIYNGYGLTGWFQSIWQDISSIDAARKNFKIGDLNRDIFQISEEMVDGTTHKVLKLGSHGGNTDSVGRPIVIANRITAIKQQKTTSEQTAQAAGLTGTWKYACRKAKGNLFYWQHSTLNFNGNKLIIATFFYVGTQGKITSV